MNIYNTLSIWDRIYPKMFNVWSDDADQALLQLSDSALKWDQREGSQTAFRYVF